MLHVECTEVVELDFKKEWQLQMLVKNIPKIGSGLDTDRNVSIHESLNAYMCSG